MWILAFAGMTILEIKFAGCDLRRRSIMNRLQKRAWIALGRTVICVVVAGVGVGLSVHLNAKGIWGLMAFLIAGLIVGLALCLRNIPIWAKFDEREKKIMLKAFIYSSYVFVIFMVCVSFGVLFLAGGKSSVSAWIMPVSVLAGIFLSNFIESAVILIQFGREQADEE